MITEFYRELSILDKNRDKELKVELPENFSFAANKIAVPIVLAELTAVVRNYPVVFTTHEEPMMVAIVGHKKNRFISEDGKWENNMYIPFAVRAYPFAAISDGKGNYLLAIDRKYEGIGKGNRIFDDKGELTDFGKRISMNLMVFINSYKETSRFIKELVDNDLLEPVSIVVTKDGKKYAFTSMQQVSREKLLNLPKEKLYDLHKKGFLYFIYLHIFSLGNFEYVVD